MMEMTFQTIKLRAEYKENGDSYVMPRNKKVISDVSNNSDHHVDGIKKRRFVAGSLRMCRNACVWKRCDLTMDKDRWCGPRDSVGLLASLTHDA